MIKRKCDKLYVKWKGYNNSFNTLTANYEYSCSIRENLPLPIQIK